MALLLSFNVCERHMPLKSIWYKKPLVYCKAHYSRTKMTLILTFFGSNRVIYLVQNCGASNDTAKNTPRFYIKHSKCKEHFSLQWRHNGCNGFLNHQPRDCLLHSLFGRRSKKTSKFRVTGLCVGNSPGTGEFPPQMASTRNMFPFDDVIT